MASITLTFTTAQSNLLASAIGNALHLGRDATLAESKAWLNDKCRDVVKLYQQEQAALTAPITDMTAT